MKLTVYSTCLGNTLFSFQALKTLFKGIPKKEFWVSNRAKGGEHQIVGIHYLWQEEFEALIPRGVTSVSGKILSLIRNHLG